MSILSSFPNRTITRAGQKEQLLRLIDRMLELGERGYDRLGMDLDGGVTCDPSIGTPYGGAAYREYLVEHGISRKIVDKLSFDNTYRFLPEIKSVAILKKIFVYC